MVQGLKDLGLRGVILTYAKETVFDIRDQVEFSPGEKDADAASAGYCPSIDAWREGTLQTIDLVCDGDYLALKLVGVPAKSIIQYAN